MKKWINLIIVIGIILSAVVIGNILSLQNKDNLRAKFNPPQIPAETFKVKNEYHTKTINTSGRMYSFEKIELYAEVSGVLNQDSSQFRPGKTFSKGEILLSIDDNVYKNSLYAQKSSLLNQLTLLLPALKFDFPQEYAKWNEYLSNYNITNSLRNLPIINSEREKYYIASNNIFKLFYDIKSMEATFGKYSIPAPYDGVVTQANINPGTLVRNGQKLGEFINTNLFEMEAAVKISELSLIEKGTKVSLKSNGSGKIIDGKVVRVNQTIDKESQSVKIYIQSGDKRIKDGMFFIVEIKAKDKTKSAKVPQNAINNNQVKIQLNNSEKIVEVEIVDRDPSYFYVAGLEDNSTVIMEKL
ncbi:MAG: efflux RND transporter periplasmic adaptor subunit [Bacteroidetes bacterium]|nr:efflux RND transporter periplasmic adaptor subunit [Bacteroidota bacterium]MBU1678023.1 efflux RND transporter periplasmic adaptor subunit [Bacteroidota bacterium]MBU2508716.1 efflux RND transporter periplasmic adaptor subunit [Bacteroidota bacterium]